MYGAKFESAVNMSFGTGVILFGCALVLAVAALGASLIRVGVRFASGSVQREK